MADSHTDEDWSPDTMDDGWSSDATTLYDPNDDESPDWWPEGIHGRCRCEIWTAAPCGSGPHTDLRKTVLKRSLARMAREIAAVTEGVAKMMDNDYDNECTTALPGASQAWDSPYQRKWLPEDTYQEEDAQRTRLETGDKSAERTPREDGGRRARIQADERSREEESERRWWDHRQARHISSGLAMKAP